MTACAACASTNTEPLPDTVQSHDADGNPVQVPNSGRTRQEHRCLDCGAYFVGPPPDGVKR